jgi:lactoylglutathione lyase
MGTPHPATTKIEVLANVDVDDLERAVEFYRDGLGLRLGRRLGDTIAEMLGGCSPIYLLQKAAGSSAGAGAGARDYRRHWTPVHLDFVVDDVAAAVRRAESAGARVESEVQTHAWGQQALLSDPFGHGFCLLRFVGRGYDEIADGGESA